MALQNLVKLCGIALILASVLYFADLGLHAPDTEVGAMMEAEWKYAHIAEGVSYLLISLGLVGLYVHQAERLGKLGLIGFIVGLLGCIHVMNMGLIYHAYLLPFIQSQHATMLSPADWYSATGPMGAEVAFVSKLTVFAQLGQILLGIAMLRTGTLPRGASVLYTVGQTLGFLGFLLPAEFAMNFFILFVLGFVAIGISYAWFGVALLRSKATTASTEHQPLPISSATF